MKRLGGEEKQKVESSGGKAEIGKLKAEMKNA